MKTDTDTQSTETKAKGADVSNSKNGVVSLSISEREKLKTGDSVVVGWWGSEYHKHKYIVRNDLTLAECFNKGNAVRTEDLLDVSHHVFHG